MPKISLASYTIRVMNKIDGKSAQLDSFAHGLDLFDLLCQYLDKLKNDHSNDIFSKKVMRVSSLNRNGRILNGIIQTGDYGYESELIDTNDGALSYKKKTNEAEMISFYFLFYIPKGRDEGVVLLQRFKNYGIRKIFMAYMKRDFPDLKHHYLVINPAIPKQVLDQYLSKGRLTKIKFVQFGLPADIADVVLSDGHQEQEGYIEFSISARRNGSFPPPVLERLREVLSGKRKMKSIIELRKQDFEYDNVKVEIVDSRNNRRIVDLSKLDDFKSYYDITNDVYTGSDGHPSFESIEKISMEILEDMRKRLDI